MIRNDHVNQMVLLKKKIKKSSYIEVRRVINFNIFSILKRIFLNIEVLLNNQIQDFFKLMDLTQYKKVCVHCDIQLLQSFMIDMCNKKNISTYSLQHGFYPSPNKSDQWKVEYENSMAQNFFSWNQKIIDDFIGCNNKRNYIHSGPFIGVDKNVLGKGSNSFIFFLSSKYDQLENKFLLKISKKIKENSNDIIFIAHPNFNIVDRTLLSMKYGVPVFDGKYKENIGETDVCFIINSSVWVELHLSSIDYVILDDFFIKNKEIKIDNDFIKKHKNNYEKNIFMIGHEVVKIICYELQKEL